MKLIGNVNSNGRDGRFVEKGMRTRWKSLWKSAFLLIIVIFLGRTTINVARVITSKMLDEHLILSERKREREKEGGLNFRKGQSLERGKIKMGKILYFRFTSQTFFSTQLSFVAIFSICRFSPKMHSKIMNTSIFAVSRATE